MDLGRLGGDHAAGESRHLTWHVGCRAAQTYDVYAADGREKGFEPEVAADGDPKDGGWKLISKADTSGEIPGQHAVVLGGGRSLGRYRYVLFDVKKNSWTIQRPLQRTSREVSQDRSQSVGD